MCHWIEGRRGLGSLDPRELGSSTAVGFSMESYVCCYILYICTSVCSMKESSFFGRDPGPRSR